MAMGPVPDPSSVTWRVPLLFSVLEACALTHSGMTAAREAWKYYIHANGGRVDHQQQGTINSICSVASVGDCRQKACESHNGNHKQNIVELYLGSRW
jgi:hypothetical protein